LSGCSASNHPAEGADEAAPATPVQVAMAKRKNIQQVIDAEALLYPLQQASIMSKISAPVSRFFVQRGDHVKKGQLLATLENRDLIAAVQENKQLYAQATANYHTVVSATMPDELTKAETDIQSARQLLDASQQVYASRQNLFAQGALSKRLVDDARVAAVQAEGQFQNAQRHLESVRSAGQTEEQKSAQAQLDAAKARYDGALAQLSYTEVRSPMDGVISDRPLNIGELASSGSPLLSVVNISHIIAKANISVTQAAAVTLGDTGTISNAGVQATGKVSVVSPAVDPNTTTVQVWIEAANPGERLKPGTTAHIEIDADQVPNAIVIPAVALLASDNGGEKVMVAGSDNQAHERDIKTGIHSGDDVQVLSGVEAGERVITEGALGLDDKARIEVSNAAGSKTNNQQDDGAAQK
jgi:multidrug efflux pump subunit AcrA (membrane-fusion protein)